MARWMVAGAALAGGRKRSRARFTAAMRVARNFRRSNSWCERASRFWVQADIGHGFRERRFEAQVHSLLCSFVVDIWESLRQLKGPCLKDFDLGAGETAATEA